MTNTAEKEKGHSGHFGGYISVSIEIEIKDINKRG